MNENIISSSKLFHFTLLFDRRNDLSPFGERAGIGAVMAGKGADKR